MISIQRLGDTIVAIATPLARSALGIVRLSGPRALDIASEVSFRSDGKKRNFRKLKSHRIYRVIVGRTFHDPLDDCVALLMKSPKSYTGEDTVEFICHGNPIILTSLVNLLVEKGARLAEPGEFTLRAMVNGKLSFESAIAVADIIDSPTLLGVKSGLNRLIRGHQDQLSYMRSRFLYWTAWFEAWIDFPEEDIPEPELEKFREEALDLINDLRRIIEASEMGLTLREGVPTLIVGKPNSGKSTLFNRLLGEDRAITSDIPGTTRDILSEYVNVLGVPLKLFDTAGLRESLDPIEEMGQKKIREYMSKAKLLILLIDLTELKENKFSLSDLKLNLSEFTGKIILVGNKLDLIPSSSLEALEEKLGRIAEEIGAERYVLISAVTGEGMGDLFKAIKETILPEETLLDEPAFTTSSAIEKLRRAEEELRNALGILEGEFELELMVFHLRKAMNYIGELTGEDVSESILDEIFSRFCVGK